MSEIMLLRRKTPVFKTDKIVCVLVSLIGSTHLIDIQAFYKEYHQLHFVLRGKNDDMNHRLEKQENGNEHFN